MYGRNQHHIVIILQLKERKKGNKQKQNKKTPQMNRYVVQRKKSVCGPTLATSALNNSHRVSRLL